MPIKWKFSDRVIWILIATPIFVTATFLGLEFRAESSVKLWLQGDPDMRLMEVKFKGQQREVASRDPLVLSYLNSIARIAQPSAGTSDISYEGHLRIGWFVARKVIFGVSKNRSEIVIGIPKDLTEYNYWSMKIGGDAPKELTDLLDFLIDEKYRGQKYKP